MTQRLIALVVFQSVDIVRQESNLFITKKKYFIETMIKNKNVNSNDTIGRMVENLCYLTLQWNLNNDGRNS